PHARSGGGGGHRRDPGVRPRPVRSDDGAAPQGRLPAPPGGGGGGAGGGPPRAAPALAGRALAARGGGGGGREFGGVCGGGARAVVSDEGEPVPVGGIGELVVGVYRTGERARWLPEGRLEFPGRLEQDDQAGLPAPAGPGKPAPPTPIEELMRGIWSEVLGILGSQI